MDNSPKSNRRGSLKSLLTSHSFLAFVPLSLFQIVCVVLSSLLWDSSAGTVILIFLIFFDLVVAPIGLGIFYLVSDIRKQNYVFLKSLVTIELTLLTAFIVVLVTRFALSGHFDNVFVRATDPETNIIRSSILNGHLLSTLLVGIVAQLFLFGAWLANRMRKSKVK